MVAQPRLLRAEGVEKLDPLKFAEIAKKDYGIEAVEYVNQFYKDKKKDDGVPEGPEEGRGRQRRPQRAHHVRWRGRARRPGREEAADRRSRITTAGWSGPSSSAVTRIRVNAQTGGDGTREEKAKMAADGLRKLTEFGQKHEIGVIVENHGGLSSDGAWLAGVMKMVDNKYCGTLPDFGNFGSYDRYKGVDELMPYAKGVSAKTHDFDDKGEETHTDYHKMMEIVVKKHKYHGFVGIEYEGSKTERTGGHQADEEAAGDGAGGTGEGLE